MVQSPWTTIWQPLKKLNTEGPSGSTSGCEPQRTESGVLKRDLHTDAHAQQPTRSNNQHVQGGMNGDTDVTRAYDGVLALKRKAVWHAP